MSLFPENTDATSPVIGGILTIAITIILALLVLLLFHMPSHAWQDNDVPAIFKITQITHGTHLDSFMVVKNTGSIGYKNQNLYAKTYKNGIPLDCIISTMNGHDFISSHHFGIQNIKGMSGQTWYSDLAISINYKDWTFHPGDVVTFEVYDTTTDQIIARHTYTA
ncbi:MAG: archaellin/type IV pilin N-terminal domain-containing protein [Methanoregula sp.]